MISRSDAQQIAEKFIVEQCRTVDGGVAIIQEKTLEKPYGWIFFYNSRRFLQSGDPLEALGGNGPVVVFHADGRVTALGTAAEPKAAISEFERSHGLQ